MFNLKEIKKFKIQLEKEKEDLELFQNTLKEQADKINASNLFILNYKERYLIVQKRRIEKVVYNKVTDNNKGQLETTSYLIDIFTQEKFYPKSNVYRIQNIEIWDSNSTETTKACVFPILDIDPTLASFPKRKISMYSLLQLHHQLNNQVVYNHLTKK